MFDLEKTEKLIIIFLAIILALGTAVATYNKYHPAVNLKIGKFDLDHEMVKQKININEASPDELAAIKGVGKSLAGRIIDYRNQKGRFACISDIKNVKGIGDGLFEKIKDAISVE